MRNCLIRLSLLLTSGILVSALPSLAAGTNYGTQLTQGSGTFYTQAIWKPIVGGVLTGTAVGITNSNIYTAILNGTNTIGADGAGNALNNTRIRSQAVAGVQVFPTNSILVLNTNTELRLKGSGNNVYTLYFGGSNGSPGLVLNGGLLDDGDATTTYLFDGLIQVASQSYISHGNNGGCGGATTDRAFLFKGILSGPGNMVILNASSTLPQIVSNINNTNYTGTWIVECGYLRGSVSNSLGTNSSIVVNPGYTGFQAAMPFATSPSGPAIFEANYDFNSGGTLTLTNGGQMKLHQNCAFTNATIEGTSLSEGLHFYSELNSNFPANFPAGGSGSITIQPYGQLIVGPQIVQQPLAEQVYLGGQARFNVSASGVPISTNWFLGASALTDGGDIVGSGTTNLLITSVAATNVGNYKLKVVDSHGNVATSVAAPLSIAVPNGEAYEGAIIASLPYAFYQLNEGYTDVSTNPPAFDNANGYDAVYGTAAATATSVSGPQPSSGWPGFVTTNGAAAFTTSTATSHLTLATPWAFKTNTVTITAWVNPSTAENANMGLVVCRGGNTQAGLIFASVLDANNQATLGYIWNNDSATYSWNSGIEVPPNQWSFVSVAVTSSNAVVSLMNSNGLVSATHVYPHPEQDFIGTTLIGDDSAGTAGNRVFNGSMDDVAVYNRALAKSDLTTLFYSASGVSVYPAEIVASPASQTLFAGQTATFTVTAGGSDPLSYQWLADNAGNGIYANLVEGGRFSGTKSQTLNIANIGAADGNDYEVIVSNPAGAPVTSIPAFLTVQATGPAETNAANFGGVNIQEAAGADWNTVNTWTDGLAASISAIEFPGTTYEVQIGQRVRNPAGSTSSAFPGNTLQIDGTGTVLDGNVAAGNATGEFRTKHSIDPATVFFPNLILNGGQLDCGDNGTIVIQGQITVGTNAVGTNGIIYVNGGGAGTTRNYEIDSYITGNGSMEYAGSLNPANPTIGDMNVTCSSNTFTGKWIVDSGTLLGSGSNSLGTNTITVKAGAALQTLYNINNTSADLILNGQLYLNQSNTFRSLFLNGIPLAVGTYTAAQLNAASPTNFPLTWAPQLGATNTTNMSGSITVLLLPAPTITQQPTPSSFVGYPGQTAQFTATAGGNIPLYLFWQFRDPTPIRFNSCLTTRTSVVPRRNTLTISPVGSNDVGFYRLIASNSIGSATSQVASVSLLPTGPPEALTLNFGGTPFVEAIGQDWTTTNAWSDGQDATISAFSNPGSTYEVVVGSRLRNPANAVSSTFPGNILTISGGGTLDPSIATTGEFRFKHTPGGVAGNGIVTYPRLVLSGGQLDNGDNGLVQIYGEVDVVSNSAIFTDTAAGQDRPVEIDGLLTGTGTITYQDFDLGLAGGLNIAGTGNVFSGQWNILIGCLVGGSPNSLGTEQHHHRQRSGAGTNI